MSSPPEQTEQQQQQQQQPQQPSAAAAASKCNSSSVQCSCPDRLVLIPTLDIGANFEAMISGYCQQLKRPHDCVLVLLLTKAITSSVMRLLPYSLYATTGSEAVEQAKSVISQSHVQLFAVKQLMHKYGIFKSRLCLRLYANLLVEIIEEAESLKCHIIVLSRDLYNTGGASASFLSKFMHKCSLPVLVLP